MIDDDRNSTLPNGFPALETPAPMDDEQGWAWFSALRQADEEKKEKHRARHRKHRPPHVPARRSSRMYLVIVLAWALLCAPMGWAAAPVVAGALQRNALLGAALIVTTVFIGYFWLNGVKDVVFPFAYRLTPWRGDITPPRAGTDSPDVCLVYVTCNDFSEESLAACLGQDYDNHWAVILDDSSKQEFKARVDAFGALHGIPVVRRPDRPRGFKAGNLNWFLRSPAAADIDYFVIVDSDEILPGGFITRALDYFEDPEIGIVQANHIATRNRTSFMRRFAPGVDSHWPAYQQVKDHAGFLSLLGHGAMVKMEAYRTAGGFPEIVAEDIGFAIDALRAGYRVAFAQDVICEEEFPPDYAAFRKRHKKWTEGNMEFIRTYSRRIFFDRAFKWHERLDIILFTYSLPLTGFFSLYILLNDIVFPELHFSNRFPLWMAAPTVVFLLAPMFNDILTYRRHAKRKLLSYLLGSVALFGSMYFVSLIASLRTTFGGSMFHVTPKESGSATLRSAIADNRAALIATAVLTGAVEYASGSVLPVILIALPALSSVWLSVMNRSDSPDMFDGSHLLAEEKE
jgi:cellulose synthase/poly-beta-1,6-N-acetylglucosamine synthase-like glycosyltransferase